ncbi:MAG: hypothetical protein U5K38_14665 [Woeseiaceae bacterium]|nr:hypothetical protein [Woeseiaceae bacterium]
MDLLTSIKDHHSERRLFGPGHPVRRRRFLSLGLVVARLVQLQVFDF